MKAAFKELRKDVWLLKLAIIQTAAKTGEYEDDPEKHNSAVRKAMHHLLTEASPSLMHWVM